MQGSLLCAVVATMLALAPTAEGAEDAAIKTKVEPCFACHGESGVSTLEGVPSLVKEGVNKADSDAMKKKLEEAGAKVEIK